MYTVSCVEQLDLDRRGNVKASLSVSVRAGPRGRVLVSLSCLPSAF
jgi:hypothetical protein